MASAATALMAAMSEGQPWADCKPGRCTSNSRERCYYAPDTCSSGGLGCNAGGKEMCRFCGFGRFLSIPCPECEGAQCRCGSPSCTAKVLVTQASGFLCGDRIAWLERVNGLSEFDACQQIAGIEFPSECGGCTPPTPIEPPTPLPSPSPPPPSPAPPPFPPTGGHMQVTDVPRSRVISSSTQVLSRPASDGAPTGVGSARPAPALCTWRNG